MLKYILIILICAIIVGLFFLLQQIPVKPVEKPQSPKEGEVINKEQIDWIADEFNASDLKIVAEEKPEIEILIEDSFGEIFTVIVENGTPKVTPGKASNPDLRITAKRDVVVNLLTTTDLNQEAINLYNEGKVKIDLLKNESVLIAKGYKEIFDAIYEK